MTTWKVVWPSKHENGVVEFELESFSFMFLGSVEFPSIEGNENTHVQNGHTYVDPGLNYRIICEDKNCVGNQKLMIVKRGYGKVNIEEDFLYNCNTELLKCCFCKSLVNESTSIKSMILFQAEVKIDFKLDSDYHLGAKSTSKNFVAAGKIYILFGDEHRRQKFESIVMNIWKSEKTHYNTVAGLTLDMFETIRNKEPPEGLIIALPFFPSQKLNLVLIKSQGNFEIR